MRLTRQRLLRRLLSLPVVRAPGRALLRRIVWTVERGTGAGLKLRGPQNLGYVTGDNELPVQQEIARQLKPGGVFYDIGANMGFFSLIAGRLAGPKGRVFAFEPHPLNASTVAENARLNGMTQLQVFPVAIGSCARRDVLQMTDWDGGATLSGYAVGPDQVITHTEVQVLSLDGLIADKALPLPTFVKIDVEGAEMEVIEGMTATIARCNPVLLFEVDDGNPNEFRRRWAELDARVSALGYRVRRLDNAYPGVNWNVGHSVAEPVVPPPNGDVQSRRLAPAGDFPDTDAEPLPAASEHGARIQMDQVLSFRRIVQRIGWSLLGLRAAEWEPQETGGCTVVFSPHFDDETLGAGAAILKLRQRGARVHIVFMTDGSRSHVHAMAEAELAAIRRQEGSASRRDARCRCG